jgi:hypothetical protein
LRRRGSFWGRLAFMGKAVCGNCRVAFSSGAGDIVTPWDEQSLSTISVTAIVQKF